MLTEQKNSIYKQKRQYIKKYTIMFLNFLCKHTMDIVISSFGLWSWVSYSTSDIHVHFQNTASLLYFASEKLYS